MGECGCGLRIVDVAGESQVAAVGSLGGGKIGRSGGDFGGEENVLGLLGGELERGDEFCGGGCRVGLGGMLAREAEIEPREGAEGAGFECRLGVGQGRGGGELLVRVGGMAGAGEEEAERDVRGGEGRIGVDGLAIAGLGGEGRSRGRLLVAGGLEGFEGEAEVVEDLCVMRGLGVEVGENLKCGGKVSGGESVVSFLDEGSLGGGTSVGLGEVLGGEGSEGESEEEACSGEAAECGRAKVRDEGRWHGLNAKARQGAGSCAGSIIAMARGAGGRCACQLDCPNYSLLHSVVEVES